MKPTNQLDSLDWACVALGGMTALAGATRLFGSRDLYERLEGTTLTYFAVAGALLLLRKVKSLSFGDYKLELQAIEAKVDKALEGSSEAIEEAKTASSIAQIASNAGAVPATTVSPAGTTLGPGSEPPASNAALDAAWDRKRGNAPDDPWKGRFGGKAESRHRRLRAVVAPVIAEEGWYRIRVWVESTDERNYPLAGHVRFFVHDTFPQPKPFVKVVAGVAELRMKAWGAFTVGALADEGQTELEFDLAEERSFPRQFRER